MCPLCLSKNVLVVLQSERKNLERVYERCLNCQLLYVPKIYHLSSAEQKTRYLEHNNDVDDPDYQNFLLPLKRAMIPHIRPNSRGIDFGAGPGPALANMFADDGFEMSLYDLYFHNDRSVLSHSYDFVVTSETVEHFESPGLEFELINNLLKEGGVMGIMTSILYESINIEKWYYRMDPTHIAFYSPETMEWIAKQYNWKLHIPFKNICIFRK